MKQNTCSNAVFVGSPTCALEELLDLARVLADRLERRGLPVQPGERPRPAELAHEPVGGLIVAEQGEPDLRPLPGRGEARVLAAAIGVEDRPDEAGERRLRRWPG